MLKRIIPIFVCLTFLISFVCGCQLKFWNIDDSWKAAYLDYIEEHKDSHTSYALVNIDDDNIPELYLSGIAEAIGDSVCTYKNGVVIEQTLNRIGGGYYNEKGQLYNYNGTTGTFYTHIYKLSDQGFTLTFEALILEKIKQLENGELAIVYEYSVDGNPIDGKDYDSAIESHFDFSLTKPLNKNAVDYNTIKEQINNY